MPAANARITERLARASILDEPGRRFTFVLTEGALGWHAGDADTIDYADSPSH